MPRSPTSVTRPHPNTMNKTQAEAVQSMKADFLDSAKSVTLTRKQTIGACVGGFILGGIVMFPLGFIVGPPAAYFLLKYVIKRSRDLRTWSQRNGWTVSKETEARPIMESFDRGLRSSHLWSRSNSGFSMFLHRGDGDARVVLCSVYNESNDDKTGSDYLVAHHPGDCPDITIVSTGHSSLLSKIPWPGDRRRVEFESAAFNKNWVVMSTDPRSAYDYLDQSTIDYLSRTEMNVAIEFIADIVIVRFDDLGFGSLDCLEKSVRWFEGFTKAVPDDLLARRSLLKTA